MEGLWLASYIGLWAVVLFQGFVIFVLLRQMGLMYLGTAQGVSRDGIAVGKQAPAFTMLDGGGHMVSLADFRGRPLLLVFGAPNCKPCQNLIPDLNVFARERAAEMSVLFLSRGDAHTNAEFIRAYEIEVPVLTQEDSSDADRYQARVTPFGFLIDSEGIIRAKGLVNNRDSLELLVRMAKDHGKSEEAKGRVVSPNGHASASAVNAEVERP